MSKVVHRKIIAAPLQKVWDVGTDHLGVGDWLVPGAKVTLDPPGSNHPNGVGATRLIVMMGYKTIERVVDYEPPGESGRMTYTVLRGFPIKNHLGEMLFREAEAGTDEAGGRTEITWTVTFEPKIPGTGWFCEIVVNNVIGKGLDRLSKLPQFT